MAPYFSSYVELDRARFPPGEALGRELTAAGFGSIRVVRFNIDRWFSRAEALDKLHGRAYSTFTLMSDEEYERGVAAAEASLPEKIEYRPRLLNVVGVRP